MNEQTSHLLASLLQKALSGIDSAVAFSQAQLPDVIRQLMLWKAALYGLRIVVGTLLLWGCVVLFRKGLEWNKSLATDTQGFVSLVLSGIVGLFVVVMVLSNIGNLLQLWLAPKIWLIEYAADLMRSGGH
ncbi:TPA: hypothetical protein M4731_001403 [Salmonella enterica]|nr:hypothetical protein [Salmonella enterica]MCH5735379.1 hypothetical protein [Salmonella enterica]MCH5741813.1 hypothetical protein [Salmonella enterica]MCH5746911.1 hypothetical protein [Salmonella enterica]MCH5757093.1 hypothetical protein [Salmonella enterica]